MLKKLLVFDNQENQFIQTRDQYVQHVAKRAKISLSSEVLVGKRAESKIIR